MDTKNIFITVCFLTLPAISLAANEADLPASKSGVISSAPSVSSSMNGPRKASHPASVLKKTGKHARTSVKGDDKKNKKSGKDDLPDWISDGNFSCD
jgi:hypothetical protein